ncbi:MAG: hypothetical protein D6731_09750 [Planctomycetota bacterium]|nr:MAG: hypothetical protein D6731_09750 [Planctomycetota bacterium]
MAKTLKISMETGRVEIDGLPAEDASSEEKNAASVKLLEDVAAELEDLERRVDEEPREVLKQVWVLHTVLEAHPARWLQNFAKRRDRNALMGRLEALKGRCFEALPGDEGQQVWEDLPYIRQALGLLFAKLKATGEVQRMILTPLGNLQHAKIRYQRDSPEDLGRVCQEIRDTIRATSGIDEEVRAWGGVNREALLLGQPPRELPRDRVGSAGVGVVALLLGLAGLGAGGAALAGALPIPQAGAAGALVVGVLGTCFGAYVLRAVAKQKAKLPEEFAELSARLRERLYLVCALRFLDELYSRFSVANEAFLSFLKEHGGNVRWKRVKKDARDLTQLFATETDWHPKETVETWLKNKVTKVFRLDSTTLAAPDDVDPEAWEAILKAYVLESVDTGDDVDAGQQLAAVGDLLFTRRGEDVAAERRRVFAQIQQSWEKAQQEGLLV